MSVLIKGMEMPKCCDDCRLLYDCCSCIVTGYSLAMINWDSEHKRLPDCPLIDLPGHGDLVDVDLLKAECKEPNVWWETETQMARILKDAPVVIPAERGEE